MKKIYLSFGTEPTAEGYERVSDWCFQNIEDGSVEEIAGFHVIDKITNLLQFGSHLYRVMMPDGKVTFDQMYFRHPMAWLSPKTIRGVSEHTLGFLSAEWRKNQAWALSEEDQKALEGINFEASYGFNIDPNFEHRNDESKAFALAHYASAIPSLKIILVKK